MLNAQLNTSLAKTPLQIGLVGCGRLAEFGYIPALCRLPAVKLVAVADVDLMRCARIAPEVPAYKTVQHLVDDGRAQAVIISTPTRCHVADAVVVAQGKLPALVEKPPGIDLKEAESLLQLVPRPWVGFNRRFDPDVARLKAVLSDQDRLKVRLELCYRRSAWNPIDMEDDALLDLGPHLIDLVSWLTNSDVTCVQAETLSPHFVEFDLELERGQASIMCCCNSPYRERVSVSSKDNHILGTVKRGGILAGIMGKFLPNRESPLLRSLMGQLEAFTCAVQGLPTAQTLGTVVDGLKVMAVIEAVRHSASAGGRKCPVEYSKALANS